MRAADAAGLRNPLTCTRAIRDAQQAEDIESGPTLSMYSSVTRHARAQPTLLDRHAAAMPGIANGGGAPNSARLSQTSELPEIDWRVAYWNLVDYCRQVRRRIGRALRVLGLRSGAANRLLAAELLLRPAVLWAVLAISLGIMAVRAYGN